MNSSAQPEDTLYGQVVASHGRLLRVRDASGMELLARPPGRRFEAVCGDRVRYVLDQQHDAALLVALEPRAGELYRSDARGHGELLAANVTLLIVVVAPLPVPDLYVVDRYLSAAACGGIGALLAINKCDLPFDNDTTDELATLERLGYSSVRCSVRSAPGVDALRAAMQGHTAMLVGQSGVGKSSLLGQLAPGVDAAIGELMREGEGRHTTTTSRMYQLDPQTALIDSPGVRDFAPAIDRLEKRALGFTEVERLAAGCRFSDCMHLREPNCAVRQAVDSGDMSARRYESYRRMRRLFNELAPPPGGSRR